MGENLDLERECRTLYGVAVQGGQRARGWEANSAMNCVKYLR